MTNSQKINVFLLICLGILLCLMFTDRCSPSIPKPVVIKGKDIVKQIDLADSQRKAVEDSFNLILNKAYNDNDKNYTAYIKTLNENSELLMENKLLSTEYPDTCKPIVAAWIERERQLKNASDRKDASAYKTITGLQGTVYEQQRFLAAKDSAYAKMKTICDTCAEAVKAWEKYAKKIAPKRQFMLGVSGMGMYAGNLNPALGGSAAYQNKKGIQIDAAVFTNKIVVVGIKKTIFKF